MKTFHDQHDLNGSARRMLLFLSVFVPIFFYGVYLFLREYPTPFPNYVIYTCATIPFAIAFWVNTVSIRSCHHLQWSITDSRIIYESPNFLTGQSFDILISELVDVVVIGDTDFAKCITSTGSQFKFYIKYRGGRDFHRHLTEYMKLKKQNKSCEATGDNVSS